MRFNRRQRDPDLAVGNVGPVLDSIVIRIRAGKLVAERFDDGVGALESKVGAVDLEGESEVDLS